MLWNGRHQQFNVFDVLYHSILNTSQKITFTVCSHLEHCTEKGVFFWFFFEIKKHIIFSSYSLTNQAHKVSK